MRFIKTTLPMSINNSLSDVRIRDLPMRDQLQRSIATRTSSTDRA
jgi:hypothetical protein